MRCIVERIHAAPTGLGKMFARNLIALALVRKHSAKQTYGVYCINHWQLPNQRRSGNGFK
jgi:hypothetical protein